MTSEYPANAKLCQLVEEHPCLYDRSASNYGKKEVMERAWADVAKRANDTISSCKERWRNIRSAYSRWASVYKNCVGANRPKKYYLYNDLKFLTKHINTGLPSNLAIRNCTPSQIELHNENSFNCQSSIESNGECVYQIRMDSPSTFHLSAKEQDDRASTSLEEDDRASTLQESDVEIIDIPTKKQKISNLEKEVPQLPKTDHDIEFLQNLLPDMRVMNARQKIVFKRKIFQHLEDVLSDTTDFPETSTSNMNPSAQVFGKTLDRNNILSPLTGIVKPMQTSPQQTDKHVVVQHLEREKGLTEDWVITLKNENFDN